MRRGRRIQERDYQHSQKSEPPRCHASNQEQAKADPVQEKCEKETMQCSQPDTEPWEPEQEDGKWMGDINYGSFQV